MRSIRDIGPLHSIPVLVRAGLNEPLTDGKAADSFRLMRAAQTLRYLAERGARVVVISHLGQKGTETLEPVAHALEPFVGPVSFCSETIGPRAREAVRALMPGHILILENLRRNLGETAGDSAFAKELSLLADVFVQDSFDSSHRPHASIVGVPHFLPSYAGLLLEEEVAGLTPALSPERPSLAVIGGAKFETKEPVLKALLGSYDSVFVGGALAHDFLKARGFSIGKSLSSNADPVHLRPLLEKPGLLLPTDALVVSTEELAGSDPRARARTVAIGEVGENDCILDIGPATVNMLAERAKKSSFVLWNGPLGNYERGFLDATRIFATALATSKAHSVIGGGDTLAAVPDENIRSRFSFISTGGGAMLDFLAKGTLPGIAALK